MIGTDGDGANAKLPKTLRDRVWDDIDALSVRADAAVEALEAGPLDEADERDGSELVRGELDGAVVDATADVLGKLDGAAAPTVVTGMTASTMTVLMP